eukprot:320242-Hanusia_phi.AAC.1
MPPTVTRSLGAGRRSATRADPGPAAARVSPSDLFNPRREYPGNVEAANAPTLNRDYRKRTLAYPVRGDHGSGGS